MVFIRVMGNKCLLPFSTIIQLYHGSGRVSLVKETVVSGSNNISIVRCNSFTIIHRLLSYIVYYHTSFTIIHHLLSYSIYYHTSFTIIHRLLSYIAYYHTCTSFTIIHRLLSYIIFVFSLLFVLLNL